MKNKPASTRFEDGFSLIELLIAMTITIIVVGLASTLLAQSLNIRVKANQNSDSLADVQRALNIMSREIANAGFNLTNNGIVVSDTGTDANGNSTLRIRANLNKFSTSASTAARGGIGTVGEDQDEDISYFVYPTSNTNLLARFDANIIAGGNSTVLANRLDSLHIHYYSQAVTYGTTGCDISGASASEVSPGAAKYLVIAACVRLAAVGTAGSPGYQPPTSVLLVSDVALRNANLTTY